MLVGIDGDEIDVREGSGRKERRGGGRRGVAAWTYRSQTPPIHDEGIRAVESAAVVRERFWRDGELQKVWRWWVVKVAGTVTLTGVDGRRGGGGRGTEQEGWF